MTAISTGEDYVSMSANFGVSNLKQLAINRHYTSLTRTLANKRRKLVLTPDCVGTVAKVVMIHLSCTLQFGSIGALGLSTPSGPAPISERLRGGMRLVTLSELRDTSV
jgi:hypothetical protein